MSETETTSVETLASRVADAFAEILRTSSSPEILKAKHLLLQRMALQGDVFSSRIPPPLNITEVGGYLNLIGKLGEEEIRTQALAAALGVAGPNPMPGLDPVGPILFDSLRPNDRPSGPAQASTPVQIRIRADFAPTFDAMMGAIHETGCVLPLLGVSPHGLPPVSSGGDAEEPDLLLFLGRVLRMMPTAALIDPDTDPLALARPDGGSELEVVARQLDAGAPNAGDVTIETWIAWSCDATSCTESTDDRAYLRLAPYLNGAGWYQAAPTSPTNLTEQGGWNRWTNTTGLVPGITRFGDELLMRHTRAEIGASSLRERLAWRWNGNGFVTP